MKNVDHSIIITYLDWQGWVLVNVIFLSETPAVSGGMREHDMIILTSPLNQERVAASRNNICRGKRKELLVGNSRNVSWTLHHVVVGQTDHEAWSLLVIVDVILHLTHSRLTHRKPSNGRMSHCSSISAGHYSSGAMILPWLGDLHHQLILICLSFRHITQRWRSEPTNTGRCADNLVSM